MPEPWVGEKEKIKREIGRKIIRRKGICYNEELRSFDH